MQAAHSIVQYQQVQDPVSDNMLGLASLIRSTQEDRVEDCGSGGGSLF